MYVMISESTSTLDLRPTYHGMFQDIQSTWSDVLSRFQHDRDFVNAFLYDTITKELYATLFVTDVVMSTEAGDGGRIEHVRRRVYWKRVDDDTLIELADYPMARLVRSIEGVVREMKMNEAVLTWDTTKGV